MMNVLGLQFGHDAGVSVLQDGKVVSCVLRERQSRIKHAISLEHRTIRAALEAAEIPADDIDYCAITSTQDIELIVDDPAQVSISYAEHPKHVFPSTSAELFRAKKIDVAASSGGSLLNLLYKPELRGSLMYPAYSRFFPEHRGKEAAEIARFGWFDYQLNTDLWRGHTLSELAQIDFSSVRNDAVRRGFHYPVTVHLEGRAIPGYFIGHHMAHAASVYYQSGFEKAAILTHDGCCDGAGYLSGMYFWGDGDRIFPISPHHLALGFLYELAGASLGLGEVGPAGKLMGLAAYGEPRFFRREYVGNWCDWEKQGLSPQSWMNHCVAEANSMGYEMSPLADKNRATAPINRDIAASTQKVFEETYLLSVATLQAILLKMGLRTNQLCLSGGTALNCPANSRIHRESSFTKVFVEPGCDDSGLAIGAALWLYHNAMDQPVKRGAPEVREIAYRGVEIEVEEILRALQEAGSGLEFTPCEDPAASAAGDLANNRVVGWFEGRSEIGPRALGHRSILADPRRSENWARVNRIKGRESWRPFAPAVLETHAREWFWGLPETSPYMLFTGIVCSNEIPAVTHADRTARVQTVSSANGQFHRLVEKFHELTNVPVVLNTSFNGPGEPIVETPQDAIAFFVRSELDALYIGGFRATRTEG